MLLSPLLTYQSSKPLTCGQGLDTTQVCSNIHAEIAVFASNSWEPEPADSCTLRFFRGTDVMKTDFDASRRESKDEPNMKRNADGKRLGDAFLKRIRLVSKHLRIGKRIKHMV